MADMTSKLFPLLILSAARYCVVGPVPAPPTTAAVCTVCDFTGNYRTLCNILINLSAVNYTTNNGVFNPKLEGDRADAWSNVQDACDGRAAKRSSHCCFIDGEMYCAPGGLVCLDVQGVFSYIINMAQNRREFVQVNYLSGGCHRDGSPHYRGTAVDMQILPSNNMETFQSECVSFGGTFALGTDNNMACLNPTGRED